MSENATTAGIAPDPAQNPMQLRSVAKPDGLF